MIVSPSGYLLDTGVANWLALDEPGTLTKVASARFLYIPNIVLGELYFGAYFYAFRYNSTKFLDLYDAFYARYQSQLVSSDAETGQLYGAIYAELRSKGQLIQQNDIWIAALARQHNLILATVDKDFERISGLTIELW